MIKKCVSKLLYTILLFQSISTTNALETTPTISSGVQIEDLKSQIQEELKHLSVLINTILPRMDSLKIDRSIKEYNTGQLLMYHEKILKALQNFQFYAHDEEKITALLKSLVPLSKGLEKGLQDSFTTRLDFSNVDSTTTKWQSLKNKSYVSISSLFQTLSHGTSRLKKSVANFLKKPQKRKFVKATPEQIKDKNLQDLIKETEQHIRTSEQLIQNLGKTWVNRTYGHLAGWWSTPLFHIAPFGGTPVYPGDIAQRILIYGGNTILIVLNLNQKIISQIPFPWLRDSVSWLKQLIGMKTELIEQASVSAESVNTPRNSFVLFTSENNDALRLNPDNGILLKKDGNKLAIQERIDGDRHLYCVISETSDAEFYYESLRDLLQRVAPYGTLYEINHPIAETNKSKTEYVYEVPDPLTGELHYGIGSAIHAPLHPVINPTPAFLNKLEPNHRLDFQVIATSITDATGKSISPRIIIPENMGMGTQQKIINTIPGHGWVNKAISSISWLVEPDIRVAFTLPLNTLCASYIYEDMAALKNKMSYVREWIHCKLSGAKIKLEPLFSTSDITFNDVVGRQAIKDKLRPYIKFVENPTLALQANIRIPRGIIFAGEPQTGKTMMAQAFLGELTQAVQKNGSGRLFRMLNVTVSDLMHHGLSQVLGWMKMYAPCLVFCDEFELSGAQRDQNKVLLADFLTALNGFGTSTDIDKMVFFLVATNHPENIDHALQEPGRMGTHIYFEMPNASERHEFFMHEFAKCHISTTTIDIQELVQETAACSYGTLQDIQSAIIRIAEDKKEPVNQKHVDYVLDEMVRRIIHDEYEIPEPQKASLAARYGAQAFASLVLHPNKRFVGATIYKITPNFKNKIVAKNYSLLEKNTNYSVENKQVLQTADNPAGMIYGGFFSYNINDTLGLVSNSEKLKLCKIALAGTVGQEVLGLDYISFDSDELLAQKYAREIVFNGTPADKNFLPQPVLQEKLTEVYNLIQQCKAEMRMLLEAHKSEYKKVVELLQNRYVIRTSDIKQCFNLSDLELDNYFSTSTTQDSK